MNSRRASGILLHPTSLSGPGGIGSFGAEARYFVDFLHEAGQSLWQILPLGPTAYGNSPYSCYSAFAGNPLLIDLAAIATDGDLTAADLKEELPLDRVDFPAVEKYKLTLLHKAASRFFAHDDQERKREFWHFCDSTFWLDDYALFMGLKKHFRGKGWDRWPDSISQRTVEARAEYSHLLGHEIGCQKYLQWQFSRQWHRLKQYANERGVRIVGDAPIFVAYDSADVWCNRHLFLLDEQGRPTVVAGVPPDYFSTTGQLWGTPLYNWEELANEGYGWWVARLANDLALYDLVRIDHFRGFDACWEVSFGEKTAINGRWAPGPGEALFRRMKQQFGTLPIIAEDLGVITPSVEALRDSFGLPGMKILQFAFDSGPGNPYLPHHHLPNSVVYTGTHDNDTTCGWFAGLDKKQQQKVLAYLRCKKDVLPWEMIRTALASVAVYAVIPLQDLLELGSTARMNMPGVASGNWGWRYAADVLTDELAIRLRQLSEMYDRNGK